MEIGTYAQRVLQRIQKAEPEDATKIFGYLLLHHKLEELMEYAVGNEEHLHSVIAEAKSYLISSTKLNSSDHLHPYRCRLSSPSSFPVPVPIHLEANQRQLIHNLDYIPHNLEARGNGEQLYLRSPMRFDLGSRSRFPLTCHYFSNGYCKHGQSCKFSHGRVDRDCVNQMSGIGTNVLTLDDSILSPGSLEKLETEIAGILKEMRGLPVSVASLPMMYKEMYGKKLHDEGQVVEGQRYGTTVLNLIKLIAQLGNIRLIDGPHGQHLVVLVEDAPKHMESRIERNDHYAASSHQIYLTFPAESTFTDADVQIYFNHFGPVHDVRIPRQEKRMFGFVSFYHPKTVELVLSAGHPHVICGARVLVKPYKEKSRLIERKYGEKLDSQMHVPSLPLNIDNALSARHRTCDTFQLDIKPQIDDYKSIYDLKRSEIIEQQPRQKPVNAQPFFGCGLDESKFLDQFSSLIIASHKNVDDDKAWQQDNNCNDIDRLQVQLPDSPFASPRF